MELDRKTYLGGSDAAAVLGLNPHRTILQTYLQKIGDVLPEENQPSEEREFYMLRGQLAEPVILALIEKKYGVKVTKRSFPESPNRYRDPEHDFIAAEIDFEFEVTPKLCAAFPDAIPRELVGTVQNGEIKSMFWMVAMKRLGEEGTDELPIENACQGMHGMMVTGAKLCMFAYDLGRYDPLLYFLHRDEATIAGMRAKEVAFWHNNVLARVPPEPSNLIDVYRMFRRRPPSVLAATPQMEALIQSLRVVSQRKRICEEGIDALQYEIGMALLKDAEQLENPKPKDAGKHVITVDGKPALTIALQEQNRIDPDAVREHYPEVAERCGKVSRFYSFTLRRNTP